MKIEILNNNPLPSSLAQLPAESIWLANFTSKNTRDVYQNAVRDFISTFQFKTQDELYQVDQGHIIAYREMLQNQGHSNATIANRLSALSSLYKFLADKQLCPLNPVSGVKRPKTGNHGTGSGKTPTLTKQQVRAMLDAPDTNTIQGLRDRAILHIFFYTGGRCSEPANLNVGDFRQDGEYQVLEFQIKGGKTNIIAIHTECQIAIRQYLDRSGHGEDKTSPLFKAVKSGKNTGQNLSRQHLYNIFKKCVLKIGAPDTITPHSARATFITQAYEAGLQGEEIQRTVGHSSITTTEGYNHKAKRHRNSASFGVNY